MARGSGPKKKKVRVVLQPVIDEASEEAVEELTGKDATPEEATVEASMPVINVPPCLEELVWATLQEVHKMRESAERWELVLGKFGPRPIGTRFRPDQTQRSRSRSGIFPKTRDRLVSGLGNSILPETVPDPVWTGTA